MKELIKSLADELNTFFNDKTVGNGGDFGPTLTSGPDTITVYLNQWQTINNPSIHVQVIQEQFIGNTFECCGGVTNLQANIRISANQKENGWSIATTLYEELRNWLCDNNYQLAPTGEDYLVIIDQNIGAQYMYEGDIFSIHTLVNLTYLRRFET